MEFLAPGCDHFANKNGFKKGLDSISKRVFLIITTVRGDAFKKIYWGYTGYHRHPLELYNAYLHIKYSEVCSKDTCLILFHSEFPQLIDSENFLMSPVTLPPSFGAHTWEALESFRHSFPPCRPCGHPRRWNLELNGEWGWSDVFFLMCF